MIALGSLRPLRAPSPRYSPSSRPRWPAPRACPSSMSSFMPPCSGVAIVERRLEEGQVVVARHVDVGGMCAASSGVRFLKPFLRTADTTSRGAFSANIGRRLSRAKSEDVAVVVPVVSPVLVPARLAVTNASSPRWPCDQRSSEACAVYGYISRPTSTRRPACVERADDLQLHPVDVDGGVRLADEQELRALGQSSGQHVRREHLAGRGVDDGVERRPRPVGPCGRDRRWATGTAGASPTRPKRRERARGQEGANEASGPFSQAGASADRSTSPL